MKTHLPLYGHEEEEGTHAQFLQLNKASEEFAYEAWKLMKVIWNLTTNLLTILKNTKEGFEEPQLSKKTTFVILNWKLGNKLMRLGTKADTTMPQCPDTQRKHICLTRGSPFRGNESSKFQTNGRYMITWRGR
jgi:hypothetical protein